MNIKGIFDNENNVYYGHGTGTTSLSVINSIMNDGLRCSHESLYFTSVALCMGNNVDDRTISLMKKWPHKDSKIIIIVSLPIKYNIIDSISIGTYNCANSAYYYIPSIESREKYRLTESNYVMPEFIKGYYDSLNDKFVPNPKYYELLSLDEQKKLFEKVKFNYITVINNTCGINKYREILERSDAGEFPLTDKDIEIAKKMNCNNLFNLLSNKIKDRKTVTFDNQTVSIEKYLWQYVYPFLPSNGIIIMKDNSVHLVSEFIENYIFKECINKYHGDARKYLFEKTKNNLGTTLFATDLIFKDNYSNILIKDITNYISKDLLEKKITIFDGTQMTVKDYIENIYGPYVPYNGKVYLKDGKEITTKEFIEEYLFKDNNIVYNGNIEQILLNLTCNNNGFIVTDKNDLINNLEIIKNSLENVKKKEVLDDEIELDEEFNKN